MDTIEEISISKIADIICSGEIILTKDNSTWDRVLSKAGQSHFFATYGNSLKPYSYRTANGNTYQNKNLQFGEFFSSINKILKQVYSNGRNQEAFIKLLSAIIDELNIEQLLKEDTKELKATLGFYDNPLENLFMEMADAECLDFIKKNAKSGFVDLLLNLHVLNMDISYSDFRLVLIPFTNQGSEKIERNSSVLLKWLEDSKPKIAKQYIEALENYIGGKPTSCISICRNIIVGIFDGSKDDETKWLKGLQKLSTDTYIQNVQVPNQIINGAANRMLGITHGGFEFSRFKTIYQIYSLASNLGPHRLEGPMIDNIQYLEKTTMSDALWILRMTEDILIWVKETEMTSNIKPTSLLNF